MTLLGPPGDSWWALFGSCGRQGGSKCRFRVPQVTTWSSQGRWRLVNIGPCQRFAAEAWLRGGVGGFASKPRKGFLTILQHALPPLPRCGGEPKRLPCVPWGRLLSPRASIVCKKQLKMQETPRHPRGGQERTGIVFAVRRPKIYCIYKQSKPSSAKWSEPRDCSHVISAHWFRKEFCTLVPHAHTHSPTHTHA